MKWPISAPSPQVPRARDLRRHFSREFADGAERLQREFELGRAPSFSRKGFTSPFGKVGRSLGQLRLHEETESLIRAAAARQGQPVMEFVREILELGFHGREEIERRHTIRLDAIELVLPKRNKSDSEKK